MLKDWFVYILECEDGALYTGISQNVDERFLDHRNGKGAQFTRSHRAFRLVWWERHIDAAAAREREKQIKGWTRRKKHALIKGDLRALKTL